MHFEDRHDAGRRLAGLLMHHADRPDVVVLGLPRGGVPVAFEVARALAAPLDVFVVRKLGFPGHEEFAMGAIASGGVRVLNPDVAALPMPADAMDVVTRREQAELARREVRYRGDRPPLDLARRTVILVDDGLATGASMLAAAKAVALRDPARVVAAVPVGAPEACATLRDQVDEMVCALTPQGFGAVGAWYRDFAQTSDDEVRDLLEANRRAQADTPTHDRMPSSSSSEV
jgi:predicted phosphoribosyltransferase